MKKTYLLIIASILLVSYSTQLFASGNSLRARMNYTIFYSPQDGPYVETQLMVDGSSIQYLENEEGKFQGSIEVLFLFRKGEEIVNFDKYELFSPVVEDTLKIDFNFIDVQRYALPNGDYEFEIQISDKNSDANPFITLNPLSINHPEDEIVVSGIELIGEYSKSEEEGKLFKAGYKMIPLISNYFNEHNNKLTFYAEVYNTQQVLGANAKFLASYYIETFEGHNFLEGYIKHKRLDAEPVKVILNELDITDLPSGNYNLVIELKNAQNELVGKNSIFFQRNNPRIFISEEDFNYVKEGNTFAAKITDIDVMRDHIFSLYPVATPVEKTFIDAHAATAQLNTLQKFLFDFWNKREPMDPEDAWDNYSVEVNKVNAAYSTEISRGYETDRGRIYLKYGPPNTISESYSEPLSYPFEIWHYYQLFDGQSNKRFVFYTEQLDTNEFFLVHSDAVGELSNYRWRMVVARKAYGPGDIDRQKGTDSWGENVDRYWDR